MFLYRFMNILEQSDNFKILRSIVYKLRKDGHVIDTDKKFHQILKIEKDSNG
jgi:hypothetical protein